MKIVCISDTHGQHRRLTLPIGDVLIHAGDITQEGTEGEVKSFLLWFARQLFQYKLFIAGNHDFFFDGESDKYINSLLPDGVVYLNETRVTIGGVTFWGSPITPWLYDGAFNRTRGSNIANHWRKIPDNTDVLITHGPPFSILDSNRVGFKAGCKSLLKQVKQLEPKLHVFGHVHESYGLEISKTTQFINASSMNEQDVVTNKPIIIEI